VFAAGAVTTLRPLHPRVTGVCLGVKDGRKARNLTTEVPDTKRLSPP
jgi:hypothetical protein